MGITRAVIGVVAAAGVARLLAPKQTERAMNAVKEGATASFHSAESAIGVAPKRARAAGARVKASASRTMHAAASRTKRAAKSTAAKVAAKTKTKVKAKAKAKTAPKVRKAAQRPRAKAK